MEKEQVNEHRYKQDPEYFEALDKRTLEYKSYAEWKKNYDEQTSKGLGDIVEKVTEVTGIKKAVKFIAGEDCGCDKRKEKLNNVRMRFYPVRCFTEQQYNDWTNFIERNPSSVTHKEQVDLIIPIYAQLFARQLKPMSCCVEPYINEINQVYETYQ